MRRRGFVFSDRSRLYAALLIGRIARRARLTDFGVTARLTARPGCIARRTPRGTNMREKKPMAEMFVPHPRLVNATVRITAHADRASRASHDEPQRHAAARGRDRNAG